MKKLLSETTFSVFLTHVGIRQIPTWSPTWKAKSLYYVGTFLPTWFFLPLQKFKTIKINAEKIPYTQTINGYYIFQGFSKIFSSISSLLFIFSKLLTTEKVQSALSIVAFCHNFFSIDIRSNQFRVDLFIKWYILHSETLLQHIV